MELKRAEFDELFCKTLELLRNDGFEFCVFEYPGNTFRDFAVLGFSNFFVITTWRNAFDVNNVRIEVDSTAKVLRQSLREIFEKLEPSSDKIQSDLGLFGFCNQSSLVVANMDGIRAEIHTRISKLVSNFLEVKLPNDRPPLLFGNRSVSTSAEKLIVDLELPIALRLKLHKNGIKSVGELSERIDSLIFLSNSEKAMLQQLLE